MAGTVTGALRGVARRYAAHPPAVGLARRISGQVDGGAPGPLPESTATGDPGASGAEQTTAAGAGRRADCSASVWSAAARQVLGKKGNKARKAAKKAAAEADANKPGGNVSQVLNPSSGGLATQSTGQLPSGNGGEDFSTFDQLKHLDPVLQAVALVPWLPDNQEGHSRRDFIKSSVMDQLESKGWDLRGAVYRIWKGERDLSAVLEGKDSGTRAALTAVMYHCKKFDEELGDFRTYAGK
mmetsp:Transcript_24403/g.63381  ORF Transcript_24403/g.63381 Transcript_24403/m.63381 type:complete len:240 (-) Transcript_24403:173-892(-)